MILDVTKMGSTETREAELAAGDWRSKPSELVPPPREPSARTLKLVHAYAGAQRVKLILGLNGEIVVLYDPNNPKANTAYIA